LCGKDFYDFKFAYIKSLQDWQLSKNGDNAVACFDVCCKIELWGEVVSFDM